MGKAGAPFAWLALALAVTVGAVIVFRVPSQDVAAAPEPPVATSAPSAEGTGTDDTGPDTSVNEPVLTVAGSGQAVSQILGGSEFHFFSETGFGSDVLTLPSQAVVWDLVDENRNNVDVIEVGFRLEALSGGADDRLLPIDTSLIPNLASVSDAFVLDANGVVPYIDGALGLLASEAGVSEVTAWEGLQAAVDSGVTVVVPAPPTDLSVVFVWALGDGDPQLGLDRYGALIASGARALRTTGDLVDAAGEGPIVGAWSSSGVSRAGRSSDIEFVVPESGAVALPGFAGILADTDQPESAHGWLNFRLGPILQTSMTFTELLRQANQDIQVPPIPVIDVDNDARPLTGFDPHAGDAFVVLDWSALAASKQEIVTELESLTESSG